MSDNETGTSIATVFRGAKIPQYNPSDYEANAVVELKPAEVPAEVSKDFDTARKTVSDVLSVGQTALKDLASLAAQSQHPKVYEQLSMLMSTLTASAQSLLHLERQNQINRQKSNEISPAPQPGQTTNNNLFVGSTAELAGILAKMRNNDGTDPKI